ncbi:MAG TPA: single-stranded DNA-binding protein [Microlunatus sp.]|nr:single-stranded DNA-binding protein [Microlunatus sp.]
MAGETQITVVGNLTGDPELRFTPSGAAVANFTVASTPRQFDKQTNEWRDGEAMFLSCSVWRQAAENVAESLVKGSRVIVSGRLKARSYETREGEKRTVFEIDVDEVGPSLRYATAKVNKTTRSGGSGGYGGQPGQGQPAQQGGYQGGYAPQGGQPQGGQQGGQPQGGDPWSTPGVSSQPAPQGDPWATQGGSSDEPPF